MSSPVHSEYVLITKTGIIIISLFAHDSTWQHQIIN